MKSQSRKFLTAILLIAAICVCQNDIFAQTAKRISFTKGKTSTVVKGAGNQSYVIRIGADQNCKIQLVSAKNAALLEVLDTEGMDLTEGSDGRSFEGSFSQAGDYRINVSAKGKTAFTLKISITDF